MPGEITLGAPATALDDSNLTQTEPGPWKLQAHLSQPSEPTKGLGASALTFLNKERAPSKSPRA